MSAIQDSNDAAFGTLRAGDAAEALNLRQNVIAVHRVSDAVAWDENIAVELRHRRIRHDEAVAVVMKNQSPFHFMAIHERRGLRRPRGVPGRFLAQRLLFSLAAWEAVSSAGEFLDGAALFELGKHLEQRAVVVLFQMEFLRYLAYGCGFASNLQKTQYVIRA
jgi:hypothetical protein